MEFISNNWLAMISLLVALIGGFPGIIAIINQRKNRPIFRFALMNIIARELQVPKEHTHTMILLTGTVSNEGNSVLTPAYFELECRLDDDWVKFEKRLIPKNAHFQSDIQDIQVESACERDLQKFNGTITTGMPLNGHLMFVNSTVPIEKVRDNPNLELKLTCRDIFGKEHIAKIKSNFHAIGTSTSHPKHGVTITTKT